MLLDMTQAVSATVETREVERLLRVADLKGVESKKDLKTLLKENNLDTSTALTVISDLAWNSSNDSLRFKAAELALKLNGDLKDDKGQTSLSVTILINDPSMAGRTNPILVPRQ